MRSSLLIGLLTIFFLGLLVLGFGRSQKGEQQNQTTKVTATSGTTGIFCRREEPYPNPLELNQAINLVGQRLGEFLGAGGLKDKMGNWFNCLNVKYAPLAEGVEGAFVFDRNSDVDNLQILVDSSYKNYTELLRALLLSHELRHVLQFLQFKATGEEAACVEKEVEAFITQYLFIDSLHADEREALRINARQNLRSEEYLPVINLFIIHKSVQRQCGGDTGGQCYKRELNDQLTRMVISNPAYREQCNL